MRIHFVDDFYFWEKEGMEDIASLKGTCEGCGTASHQVEAWHFSIFNICSMVKYSTIESAVSDIWPFSANSNVKNNSKRFKHLMQISATKISPRIRQNSYMSGMAKQLDETKGKTIMYPSLDIKAKNTA